jgi:6-phosphogluconolactonase
VSNDNRFALSADLGTDQLFVYRFDAAKGSLAPDDPAFAKVKSGSGPRHFVFGPSGKWVYLANELASTITVFSYDERSGALVTKQTVRTLPKTYAGDNLEAEIVVDAKGKFLYVSNRGDDSISVFSMNAADGTLAFVQRVPSGGKTPRNFAIDPSGSWLFAANQESNNIGLFRVDSGTGRLIRTRETAQALSPACVIFVPMK